MDVVRSQDKPRWFINRNFLLLWLGQTISPVGDFFLTTTLILWITTELARGQSWLPLAVSGVALSTALATLLVGPLAGVFSDRWEKRSTMLRMDLLRGMLILLLLILTGSLPWPLYQQFPLAVRLGIIYLILFLVGACAQFFNPSRMGLLGDIVEKEQRTQASGLQQAAFNIALILGPMLAAPLFLAFGARWAMLIDAASFFVSFACIFLIKIKVSPALEQSQKEHTYWQELRRGWQTILQNRALSAMIVHGVLLFMGAGTMDAFYLLFALHNLHTPANLAGLFGPAYGIGVILASLPAARLAHRIGEGRQLALATIVWGLLYLLFARCSSFVPGVILFGLMGVSNGFTNVCTGPLLLHLTPREFVGRVSAVLNPAITLSSLLSAALAGYLVSGPLNTLHSNLLGLPFDALDTVLTCAGLLIVLAGLYGLYRLVSISTTSSGKTRT